MRKTILTVFLLSSLISYYYFVELKPESESKRAALASMKLYVLPESARIQRIQVIRKNSFFEVEGKDDLWRIIDPVLEMGDALIIGGMERVLMLQNKRRILLEETTDLREFGLANPDIRVGVLGSHANSYRYLLIGKQVPFEKHYYAKWEEEASIFLLGRNTRNVFDKELFDVRDKAIFNLSFYDAVKTLELHLTPYQMKFTLEAEKKRWVIKEPFPELGKKRDIEKLIKDLQRLYIENFLTPEEAEGGGFGFKDDSDFIRIQTQKESEFFLKIGNLTDDDKFYYASTPGRAVPILIAKDKLDSLRLDPIKFIERRIILFKPYDIQKLLYEKGDRKEVVSEENEVLLYNEEKASLEFETEFDSFLEFLSKLEYQLILNEKGVSKLKLKEEDLLFSLQIFDVPPRGEETRYRLDFYSKKDGFFIESSTDVLLYEISEEDYKSTISFIERLFL